MLAFYEEKGTQVIVHDDNATTSKRTNVDNIEEILEVENKIEYINSRLRKFKKHLDTLDTNNYMAKLINIFSVILGIGVFGISYLITKGQMPILLTLISLGIVTIPMGAYDTWAKIGEYYKNYDYFKDRVDALNIMLKRAYRRKLELEQSKRKVNTESDEFHEIRSIVDETRKELEETADLVTLKRTANYATSSSFEGKHVSKTPLVDRYRDSKVVSKFKEHGVSDEKIEEELKSMENDILNKPQPIKVDIYKGLSFEESCAAFERQVNDIHREYELNEMLERVKR